MPTDTHFWLGLAEIVWINLLLSGDNAVVIALACRSLPPAQRRWGILLGVGPAILLRILFTLFVGSLLAVPYLKLIGAALLLWIAVNLILPQDEGGAAEHGDARHGLWAAARTIVVADAVMSLDNVVAIAAAAKGDTFLLLLGLILTMPMIVFGSALLMQVMERYPVLVTAGAALLGWIAGELTLADPALGDLAEHAGPMVRLGVPACGAALVVSTGHFWAAQKRRARLLTADLDGS